MWHVELTSVYCAVKLSSVTLASTERSCTTVAGGPVGPPTLQRSATNGICNTVSTWSHDAGYDSAGKLKG